MRKVMSTVLGLSCWLGLPLQVHSADSPMIYESLEWLCTEAEEVLVGSITAIHDHRGSGKNRQLFSVDFKGTQLGKTRVEGSWGISLRQPDVSELEVLRDKKTRVLTMLRSTAQGYQFQGRSMNQWALRYGPAKGSLFVPLGAPMGGLPNAATQRLLQSEEAIVARCAEVQQRIKAQRCDGRPCAEPTTPGDVVYLPPLSKGYVPVASGSALAKTLCPARAKGCWLQVPTLLFSKALPRLP